MLVKHFAIVNPSWTRYAWGFVANTVWSIGSYLIGVPDLIRIPVGLLLVFVVGFVRWTEEPIPTIWERWSAWRAEGKQIKKELDDLK